MKNHYDFKGAFLVAGCGSSLYTQSILLSLAAYTDLHPNSISIYYYNIDSSKTLPLIDALIENDTIQIYSQETCPKASWLILDSGHNFEEILYYQNLFRDLETLTCEKAVYISDYQIYAPSSQNIHYSECELASQHETEKSSYFMFLESLFQTFVRAKKCQFSYMLRAGQLMGSYAGSTPVHSLIHNLATQETLMLELDHQLYPTIYIGDFLRAVFWGCHSEKRGMYLYNLCTANITLQEVILSLRSLSCSHAKLSMTESPNASYGIGMSTEKIILDGWKPLVSSDDYLLYTFAYYKHPDKPFSYSDYYKDYKLDRIHELLLDMLFQVDSICKKHDIQYFLAGGTLLGAIRNNGFIPWDNDLDLMMTRKNYNRFIQFAKDELPNHLFLQAENTDPENHFYSKVRLNSTLLVTPFNANFPKLHNGIFLDIFPQDQTANNVWLQKVHIATTVVARSMVFNKWGNTPISGDGSHPFIRTFFTLIKNSLPMHLLETIQYKVIRLFEYKKNPKYLYDGMGQNIRRGAFPAYWLDEVSEISFEGHSFPIPRYAHEYLEYLYGPDYQYPVPLVKRKLEHNIQLTDLGPYI